jgi:hypothetical protein
MQVAAACLCCGNAPSALQHLELWAGSLTGAARWPSQHAIDRSRLHTSSHIGDADMHERDAYRYGYALRSLQMEDDEALLWATLRMLGDADCAAGLATTPKVSTPRACVCVLFTRCSVLVTGDLSNRAFVVISTLPAYH